MIKLYVKKIKERKMTLLEVPEKWRVQVKDELLKHNIPFTE